MSNISFNAADVAPQAEFDLLPAGRYLAQVIESDVSRNSKDTGDVLKLTFEILEGEHVNRRLWARLNIAHDNPDAERIGRAQLSALCHAVGVLQLTDSTQLHGKPVLVTVKIRKDKSGTYPDQNDVSGFAASGATPTAARPVAAAPSKAAPTPPWQQKKVA